MNRLIIIIVITLFLASCVAEHDDAAAEAYPLLALYEATKSLDGERVKVAGYFGLWENDMPVLYASRSAFNVNDGLYKSHLIFKYDDKLVKPNSMVGSSAFLMSLYGIEVVFQHWIKRN